MDLLGKVALIVIILVVIFTAGFLIFNQISRKTLTSAQAVQLTLNDVQANNPGANVTVLSVTNSTYENSNVTYNIVLSIVYNSTRPCPTVGIEQFDYPEFQLSSSYPNFYTQGHCIISNLNSNASTYVINNPEIAIARSYNQSVEHGIANITNYVSDYGYNNTSVTASYYAYLNNTQTHLSQGYYNVWLIRYTAASAPYSIFAVMYLNGSVVNDYVNSSQQSA